MPGARTCGLNLANNLYKQNATQCAVPDPTRHSVRPMIWQPFSPFRAEKWSVVQLLVRMPSAFQWNTIEVLSTAAEKLQERLSISGAERWLAQTFLFVRFWAELC